MKKNLFIALATLFVALGTVGIFIPLLPTTPFLLLAVYFYMNSSKKRLKWLLSNKLLGPYIKSYFSKEGIPVNLKIRTLLILWATMISTMIFATDKIAVRILLTTIAIGVTIHIAVKKTKKTVAKEICTKKRE
ncbi:MAG: YbaN family protein [Bacteroidales bacterium]|nr:YbaN family protein [Bacteroidales bacterium]MDD4656659.1 YbaN family protein [Bacteroidales bacterium]